MIAELTIQKKVTKYFDDRILFVPVHHGETKEILGCPVTFFDIFSTKAKQFGFTMLLPNGVKFTCCGDEPYNEKDYEFVKGSDWLTHEAFCLYGEADQLAEELQIPHLILYHTEETHLKERKELYTREGREYYHGKLFVPDDLEVFEL